MLTGLDIVLYLALWAAGKGLADAHFRAETNAAASVTTDPQVDAILAAWEKKTSNVSGVSCEFRRFKYDRTLSVDFRSVGSLSVDRFGSVDYDVRPAVVPKGVAGRKLNSDGQPYEVRPDFAERIQFTREVITIDQGADLPPRKISVADLESTLERGWWTELLSKLCPSREAFALPPEGAGIPPDLMELPLWRAQLPIARPFVLSLSRAEILAKFRVKIVRTPRNETALEFIPRAAPMTVWYASARLILNRDDFTPVAVLTKEADGQTETVHVFSEVKYVFKKDGE